MIIERSGFLLMTTVLAVGGFGGWALHKSGIGQERIAPPPVAAVPAPDKADPAAILVVDSKPAAPACDDSIGTPGECPAVGPSDEAVCGNIVATRCADYKAAFKPKVAQQAVACLLELKASERCDPARVNLCGHAALMSACPELEPPAKGNYVKATGTIPASFTLVEDPKAVPSPVAAACDGISKTCSGQSATDCQQTLSGMNDSGRSKMVECMSAHCRDKGLIGCEAMQSIPALGQARR